eukprot:CAMPEP_0202890952 /NCGR_PEP_ID=MMETSP1392-20130828/1184_1 /ASSEMBLY_ACC=CAM_ASM_000868 /TAXON_ID=225041 /ORGANISM="Chlamydomonas chlamydogama, Strain SAG 11-48b" /LENGTH=285 /DNA_ID=CAMNT_0049574609 /DNA_START=163 /DNA_END=1020 /DNA_ORIENTATION=+
MADESKVVQRLRELLPTIDLETTTEKMLRKQLEEELNTDLTELKPLIRKEIEAYLDSKNGDGADEEEEEEEEEEEKRPKKKRGAGGLNKPCVLSEAMQEFLGVANMSRPQVVKQIWEYIRANNLQDPRNKRNIICDDKLKLIFKPPVNMFTMNKQLSKHIKRADEVGISESDGDDLSDDDSEGGSRKRKAAPKKAKKAGGGGGGGGGFTKPVKLVPELAEFVGAPTMSRPQLTSFFNNYFKEMNLKDPQDKRFVISDDKLKSLLKVDRFQAFGLQKYLGHLIQKD